MTINPLGNPWSTVSRTSQAGSSFLGMAALMPNKGLVSVSSAASSGAETIAAYAKSASGQVQKTTQDAYAVMASAVGSASSSVQQFSSSLMIEDAKGARTAASNYLNPAELKLLQQLPENIRRQILSIDQSQPVERVRSQMQERAKSAIQQIIRSDHVKFKDSGVQWELGSLLSLANAINRLPSGQLQQLENITFERRERPEMPSGVKLGMIDKIASDTIAGHYDINRKTVTLYNRGVEDGFPVLGESLRQNLRVIQNKGSSEDIRQLQKLLNPYMVLLQQPALSEDGNWGNNTARAIRMVQAELLSQHLQKNYQVSPQQLAELKMVTTLAASPQFDLITRMTDIQQKMQNLNLIPDPHLKQLLQEFSRSEFGEASLKFLMQDISSDFRSTPGVSRVEEIMTHEMGHHFQLGNGNESYYIGEFAKLSNWRESATGEKADGFINGLYSSEDLQAAYHKLACNCQQDKGKYQAALSPAERSQKFVSDYAATDPMEDFAESYKDFILNPVKLMAKSPEKFFFMNSLEALQTRKTGITVRDGQTESGKTYDDKEIEKFVSLVLSERYQQTPSEASVKTFISEQFKNLMDLKPGQRKFDLNSDAVLAMVEAHKNLLGNVNAQEQLLFKNSQCISGGGDELVFRNLHQQTKRLVESQGQDPEAKAFFQRFNQPQAIDKLFPQASPEMRQQLKDPSYAAMTLALGKIGGYGLYLNQLGQTQQTKDQSVDSAKSFFGGLMEQPAAIFSNKTLTHSWNLLRGAASSIYDPVQSRTSEALAFFDQLETNPEKALPDIWNQLPAEFQDLLRDKRFIESLSGNEGRYVPSSESARKVFKEVVDMLEFQRSLSLPPES